MSNLHKFKQHLQGKGKYLAAVAALSVLNDRRPEKTIQENVTHLITLFPEYGVFKDKLLKSSK